MGDGPSLPPEAAGINPSESNVAPPAAEVAVPEAAEKELTTQEIIDNSTRFNQHFDTLSPKLAPYLHHAIPARIAREDDFPEPKLYRVGSDWYEIVDYRGSDFDSFGGNVRITQWNEAQEGDFQIVTWNEPSEEQKPQIVYYYQKSAQKEVESHFDTSTAVNKIDAVLSKLDSAVNAPPTSSPPAAS